MTAVCTVWVFVDVAMPNVTKFCTPVLTATAVVLVVTEVTPVPGVSLLLPMTVPAPPVDWMVIVPSKDAPSDNAIPATLEATSTSPVVPLVPI